MSKWFSISVGIVLVLTGLLALVATLLAPLLGFETWYWAGWRLWPLAVVAVGLLFVLPPLLTRGQPGLGGLYIPGMPVLVTGGILLLTNTFNAWGAWAWLWPLEVLALALGFLFAAAKMRIVWLLIPASIFGLNGLLMQFCAVTGWWEVWSVAWTVELWAVGLPLLLIGVVRRSPGLRLAGLIVCGLAALGLVGMLSIFGSGWLFGLVGPAALIFGGVLLLAAGLLRRSPQAASEVAQPALEPALE